MCSRMATIMALDTAKRMLVYDGLETGLGIEDQCSGCRFFACVYFPRNREGALRGPKRTFGPGRYQELSAGSQSSTLLPSPS